MKGERKLSLVSPPSSASSSSAENGDSGSPLWESLRLDANRALHEMGEADVTDEELIEAEALQNRLDRDEDEFVSALRFATRKTDAKPLDLDSILAVALGDVEAPATSFEEPQVERLRTVLAEDDAKREGRLLAGPGRKRAPATTDSTADVAVALRVAWAPTAITQVANEGLIQRVLADHENAGAEGPLHAAPGARATSADGLRGAPNNTSASRRNATSREDAAPLSLRRVRLGRRTFATMAAVVAMAAGALLFVRQLGQQNEAPQASMAQAPAATSAPTLANGAPSDKPSDVATAPTGGGARIAARSTTDLFDASTPFPRTGGESGRMDRIYGARARDLRANRFASWGVR